MVLAQRLHAALVAVCPIEGVSIGRANDRDTWKISYAADATDQQKAAATVFLAAFDPTSPTVEQVNAERDRRLTTFAFNGDRFDLFGSETKISGAGMLALASVMTGAAWDSDFAWIAADNATVPMDAQTTLNFAKAAADWTARHIHAARVMKNMPRIPADYASDARWPS